ncbi:TorF family putative porin [Pseudoduganella violaceinigra]|uniref:TorF family putative porin n=1 Tax=Pseudoduganella violaceinigra TaxID=246602 RepID=UPI0003F66E48|nr:TorF family putative porin [Pseudoduganella violaceinigra]
MKFAFFFAAAFAAAPVLAADEVSFNTSLTSDYRYRGISQSRLQPAIQGGAEFAAPSTGLYAGAWASSINWTRDAGGAGRMELDIYAGKRGQLSPAISYDAGILSYIYKGRIPGLDNPDTWEIYGQLGYGPFTLKYSHALTSLFGFADSKSSGYLDLSAGFDLGSGMSASLHAGRQRVHGNAAADYSDWKLGVGKDLGVASLQLAVVGTNANRAAYASPANGKFLGKNALQLTVSRNF